MMDQTSPVAPVSLGRCAVRGGSAGPQRPGATFVCTPWGSAEVVRWQSGGAEITGRYYGDHATIVQAAIGHRVEREAVAGLGLPRLLP